ncbi:hypothetical protein SAPIO_CDS8506 [Scedosporium apiospermum]|uniref:Rhodopsin domain-containing protein n=1 Tax=Pseudallescheria apiosperma TaxID=563466 RepID=A0A084FZT0_PSEDA|nr:uncharacterized protein SAPIO_CDS8506 [Scedosporium apiospermum]KEZ40592.1 hypothetical protein SAPIO_CDS8506 [Scedosporium apiospermum]
MPTAFQSAVVTSSASATGAATTTFIPIIVNAATSSIDAVVESEVPAATVPSSVPPGVDLGPLLNFTTWLMTGLAFAILMLRIYCKASRKRRLWWDDYVLSLAWICLAVAGTMTTVSVNFGYGRHLDAIAKEDLDRMPTIANAAGFTSVLAAMWSKTSFALTLARISEGWIFRLTWIIIVSINLIMGSSAIMVWIDMDNDTKINYFIFTTAYSGAMDVLLSMLPWKIIWHLRMTKKEKIGVLVAMSMGVFAGATSFIKVSRVPTINSPDPIDSVQLVIFGIAESATTIIAASIPVLRALIHEGKSQRPKHQAPIELDSISSKVPLRRAGSVATDYSIQDDVTHYNVPVRIDSR